MRILILSILLFSRGISLYASDGGALSIDEISAVKSSEEVTAGWEKDSDAELWGNMALSGLRSGNGQNILLNAYCSPESIEKIIKLRQFAADIMSASGTNGMGMFIAGRILERTSAALFSPLTSCEKKLLSESLKSVLSATGFNSLGLSPANIPQPEYAVAPLNFSFITSTVNKLKIHNNKRRGIILSSAAITCAKNLFDMEFADFYRLFLYVRDNSGNGKLQSITYNTVSLRFNPFLFNSTDNNNTSITEIIQSGASS